MAARASPAATADVRRAIVMGAGEAARMLLAGIHEQGWTVLGLLDDDPAKRRARIGGVPVLGPLDAVARQGGARRGHACHRRHALGHARRSAGARWTWPAAPGCRC
jgi:FlaA1/EpsC-like NDP-sugar epimerase